MKVGLAICTFGRPQQLSWWAKQLLRFRQEDRKLEVCISSADETPPKLPPEIPLVHGPNFGVAYTKNRALRHLWGRGCDLIVLAEDDCQIRSLKLLDMLAEAAEQGCHHLMLGPVTEHATWRYTGREQNLGALRFREYERTREPQDTPGVITMVTRHAVDVCGGLDGRFLGRGHAHGEYTERIERHLPSPPGSQFWHLESGELVTYL